MAARTVTTITLPTGTQVHGEIVSWDVAPKSRIPYTTLVESLKAAGLDAAVARKMSPRDAFARAASYLSDQDLIRKIDETAAFIRFQFTAEAKSSGRLEYEYKATLTLCKATGEVSCEESPELADKARKAIETEANFRYCNDITRITQRLFEQNADLFPVRASGGCYFVPAVFSEFCGKIEAFLTGVNGSLRRFPVPAGTRHGDQSVSASVTEGLERLVDEHTRAVDGFDETTRDSTLEKQVTAINNTRFKLESYAEFLGEKKAEIEETLNAAREALREKIAGLARTVDVPAVEVAKPLATPERDAVERAFAAFA